MIAVFDSGYGGLTVLKPLLEKLPQYDYIYLGDSARTPYGNRGSEVITQFGEEAVEYLFEQGAKVIIVACNTASSIALRHLQQKYLREKNVKDRKILGVIKPLVEEAVKLSRNKLVSIVGTSVTVRSHAYKTEIQALDAEIKVFEEACPLLVPLIEEHWQDKPEAKTILKKYLIPIKSFNSDVLILGCTHYPLMYKEFKKIMGKNVHVLNSGEVVAKSFENYLERHPEIEKLLSKKGKRLFLTTDRRDRFETFIIKNMNMPKSEIRKISL